MPELNKKVRLWRGDITRLQVDAITNAANWKLQGGRGICGAIFQKAGWHQLQAECNMLAPCPEGQTNVRGKITVSSVWFGCCVCSLRLCLTLAGPVFAWLLLLLSLLLPLLLSVFLFAAHFLAGF